MTTVKNFRVHHIGCAVNSIKESIETYRSILGFKNVSEIYELNDIGINACFVELSDGFYMEFIEASNGNSVINNYLKKGITYYHTGYKVDNIDLVVSELEEKGFKFVSRLNSPAFAGKKCVFMYTPELQLIELIDT